MSRAKNVLNEEVKITTKNSNLNIYKSISSNLYAVAADQYDNDLTITNPELVLNEKANSFLSTIDNDEIDSTKFQNSTVATTTTTTTTTPVFTDIESNKDVVSNLDVVAAADDEINNAKFQSTTVTIPVPIDDDDIDNPKSPLNARIQLEI